MSRIGVLKNEPFFSGSYSFPQPKMSVKCPFITNLVLGKVEKENSGKVKTEKFRT